MPATTATAHTTATAATPQDWPGRSYGVRAPAAHETPLSAAEVIAGLHSGLIAPSLPRPQREEAIEALAGDALLPVVRRALPAGTWRGHTPAHTGLWGGLVAAGASAANDETSRRSA